MRKPPFELSDIEDESPPMKPSAPASIFTTTKPAPSWHDKPTEPGLWVIEGIEAQMDGVKLVTVPFLREWGDLPSEHPYYLYWQLYKWFGPIPPRIPADVRPEVPE